MEVTCQATVRVWNAYAQRRDSEEVCGAPIPRLDGDDGSECVSCGHEKWDDIHLSQCLYRGPLASECANGHPVAVPTEAERRG